MKVLMIGGTGLISTAVTKRIIEQKMDLYLMNRGQRKHDIHGAKFITCDINDEACVNQVLSDQYFDVIVDWIAFTVDHVKRDYRLFKDKTKQYIFISSASAYQKPLPYLPVTEEIPVINTYWTYSQQKADCETYLRSIKDPKFNVTIIRPSHTFDERSLVFQLKPYQSPFTMISRILNDEPIVIPDQGNSKWTLTSNQDFAYAFVDVLGNEETYHQSYHITSEKVFTWNEIILKMYETLKKEPHIIYIPTDFILKHFPEFKGDLYGDKKDDTIFDNSKIKSVSPNYRSKISYLDHIPGVLNQYLRKPQLQTIDENFIKRYDELISDYLNQK